MSIRILRCVLTSAVLVQAACLCLPSRPVLAAEPPGKEELHWHLDSWRTFVQETGIEKDVELGRNPDNRMVYPLWEIQHLSFSADGTRLEALQWNMCGQLVSWDLSGGRLVGSSLIPFWQFCLSPDFRHFLMVDRDDDLQLREMPTGKTLWKRARGSATYCYPHTFSPDGTRVVFNVGITSVYCCDVDTGKPVWNVRVGGGPGRRDSPATAISLFGYARVPWRL